MFLCRLEPLLCALTAMRAARPAAGAALALQQIFFEAGEVLFSRLFILTMVTQQIHSLRASGARLSQRRVISASVSRIAWISSGTSWRKLDMVGASCMVYFSMFTSSSSNLPLRLMCFAHLYIALSSKISSLVFTHHICISISYWLLDSWHWSWELIGW